MATEWVGATDMQKFLDKVSGMDSSEGNARTKAIVRRIIADLFQTIDELDVEEDEFWNAVHALTAGAPEFGLWAAGLGFEHFLDIRMDRADAKSRSDRGTPRTIEGPLYVAGAPRSSGFARLDDGTDDGETLIMKGRVLDPSGKPVPGAVVDVWHANTRGSYSYFDKTQSDFNLRRQIVTDAQGGYKFQSIMPSGYAVPPNGSTERLLEQLGRHGRRPAHIHFFVSAEGHRHLTTQVNIDGDPYLHDDFAYATRDELISRVVRREDAAAIRSEGLQAPFNELVFDFTLCVALQSDEQAASNRHRVAKAA